MAGSRAASRRQFLSHSLATGAAAFAAPAILRAQGLNEKLHVAVVGCGGRGGSSLEQMLGETVVALCDVNRNALDYASGKVQGAKSFTDYRKMYDELKEGSYDAVVGPISEVLSQIPSQHLFELIADLTILINGCHLAEGPHERHVLQTGVTGWKQ